MPIWIAVAALIVILAVVVVVVLLSSGDSKKPKTNSGYRQNVAQAFGPVLGANERVSRSLQRLRGTDPVAARADVSTAQRATTAARGALGALSVPPDGAELDRAARQVLDREDAYLSAVAATLRRPSTSAASELQTLASNLTSAMSAAGPEVAGDTPTISGTGKLVAWAPVTARKLAATKKKAAKKPAAATSGGTAAPATATSLPGGRSCGAGVYAGANTTCVFALRVKDAYYEAPGIANTVRVYSPATGQTYTMSCSPSGDGTTCSGGNGASVTF